MTNGLTFILGLALGITLAFVIHRYWKGSPAVGRLAQNIILALLAVFLTLMAAEVFFKVFFAQSDAWNQTLASQNWFKRYWSLNSMGYRDVEWSKEDLRVKKKILVLGDSFAAGQGIEHIEDRFSNLLGAKLGDDYLVMNIATPGISTQEEIDRVRGFPYKPDILIFQYFVNDIRYVAHERGVFSDLSKIEPRPLLKPLIDNSYVLNFIYWRSIRLLPGPWQPDDFNWLQTAYNDPEIWWLHQQELLTILEGANAEGVKLIVVVFPSMTGVEQSEAFTAKVRDFFVGRQVPVLDVTELVKNVPPKQLVVNALDAHPGEWVHAQVADRLYRMVVKLE